MRSPTLRPPALSRGLLTLLLGLLVSFVSFVSLVAVVGVGPASAHDAVETTVPGDGKSVEKMPESVTLTMSEVPLPVGLQVLVKGPDGKSYAEGTASVAERTVTQQVSANAPGGSYEVAYRVTSSDGHPVTGTFRFFAAVGRDGSTATATPTGLAPQPDTKEAGSGQLAPILLTVIAAVVLGTLAMFLWLVARRRSDEQEARRQRARLQAEDDDV